MNENIDLTKILKNCPKDAIFYSSIYGNVIVSIIDDCKDYPIAIYKSDTAGSVLLCRLTKEGKYNRQFNGECTLFPSKDQRDWSKFTAPLYKNEQKSSDIYKKDLLGKWININNINPIEIKDLKPGNYFILRIVYNKSINFDYKLAYVDFIKDGQVKFHIQDINISNTSIKITDFCIFPDYISNNFYKINNK